MLYLKRFAALSRKEEEDFLWNNAREAPWTRRNYTTRYPFNVFRYRELPEFEFAPLTIFYGGNGCGKTTLLNVIAEKLELTRGTVFNKSDYFGLYVQRCRFQIAPGQREIPPESKIITSDDVFDYLLDLRCMNQKIDLHRGRLFDEFLEGQEVRNHWTEEERRDHNRLRGLDEYEAWRRRMDAQSDGIPAGFIRERLIDNIRERSNGESALEFFTESIRENALYLLDEPENSLSAPFQLELKKFLEDSVRYFGCQFIISTHSPFLLSVKDACIYDLDAEPPCRKPWTALENMRLYARLFGEYREAFDAT